MNGNTQVDAAGSFPALLDQQHPQQQPLFATQLAQQSKAFVNPMTVAMAMAQPTLSVASVPAGSAMRPATVPTTTAGFQAPSTITHLQSFDLAKLLTPEEDPDVKTDEVCVNCNAVYAIV